MILMSDEMMQCAEEIFFERYFEFGSDKETALANFETSLKVLYRSCRDCADLAEKIQDGEVVDVPTSVLALQNMIFAHRYACQFKRRLGDETPLLDISTFDLEGKSKDQLAKEGAALIASSKESFNLLDLEKGKYLLYAAICA